MREILSGLKNNEFFEEGVTHKSALTENQLDQLDALADAIAAELAPVPSEP